MKKIHFFKYLFILLCTSISAALQAQNFKLIDANKIGNSYPQNNKFSTKNAYAYLNGFSYFTADDGIHGSELWRTDGTNAGTKLVKDVNPGTASSNLFDYDITASGGKIYFSAYDGAHGKELWVSDGTAAGTQLVTDIAPGNAWSYPSYLTDVNGTLFFFATYYDSSIFSNRNQLWKTDGTTNGTILISDFTNGVDLQRMINVNGRLFFTFYDYNTGAELYTSDGTTSGTILVADINPYSSSLPTRLTAFNDLLYFAADDGAGGKLWVTDGTAAGTRAVTNNENIFLPVHYDYFNEPGKLTDSFAIANNVLYFQGSISTIDSTIGAGNELCKYDPSDPNASVTMVKDIIAGANSSYPSFITNVDGTLFFTIGPAGEDAQLWRSDGSEAGTVLVKSINPGGDNFYYGLTSAYGILLFAYGNEALGFELWKSDGTDAGTKIVKDINQGVYSSFPQYITFDNGLFLFGASNGANGFELWKSDGTTDGTTMVKNINKTSTASSWPYGFTATANNKVVFAARDEKYGYELRVTDGTNSGTKLAKDIYPGFSDSYPYLFTNFQNNTYFFARDTSGLHLWKTNGTSAGTKLLPTPGLVDEQNGYISNMLATDDLLYIVVYSSYQYALWRTDGTAAGTYALKPISSSYYYPYPTAVGNTLFFADFDFNSGAQLWKTDGTLAGTELVKTIVSSYFNPLANLYNFNGKLFFSAYTTTNNFGPSLWTSDGTETGTRIVKEVAVVQQPLFAQANGKLFFYALDAISKGYELFSSDGTTAGTKIVKDINSGAASSNVFYPLISGDSILYFIADDGKRGTELWKSDGTRERTKLVKDISPGINRTYFNNIVNVNDNLFFTVNDTLWQSDGTKANTHPVKDANLKGVTNIYNLTLIGDSLYFSGYTYAAGQELYAGSADINKAPSVILTTADNIVSYTAPARIKLNAKATDEDGTIGKVEFYNGTTLLHTEYLFPYGFLWREVSEGDYTLTAKAYDDKGWVTTSNTINLSVVDENVPPVVSIVNPVDDTTYTPASGGATIRLIAEAKDANDRISKVEFYNGTDLIRKENIYPYAYTWSNVQPGTYTLTAKATDEKGLSATSSPVTVTVTTVTALNAPMVSSTSSSENTKAKLNGALSVQLSPNPAGNILNIYTNGLQQNKQSTISVVSASGVVIKTVRAASNQKMQMDVSSLRPGVYYLKASGGDKILYMRFFKIVAMKNINFPARY